MEKGPSVYAEYWTSPYNEGEHFGSHGKQMGYPNTIDGKENYSKSAKEFADTTGNDIISFTSKEEKNHAVYKFNIKTKELAIISKDGKIITYYPVRDGLKYFYRQFEKYGDYWN